MEDAPARHNAGRCGQKVNCPRGAREAALGRRPLPGGGGTQRPGWAVKRRSRPLPRDESACFRGATHVQSGIPLPLSFCCGKGTTPVSGPAGKAVSRPPAADAFSRRRPSLLRRCGRYVPRQGGFCSTILPQSGEKVNREPPSYAVKGLVLGLMISRQSRSPRSRPWMRISAVATLVAKGMLYWSHRRVIYMTLSSMSVSWG